jgi:hypothetical protein
MAVLNFATREITARIVYFGASGAGCNTNTRALYDLLAARDRSKLHKFGPAASDEISWYFDYAPVEPLGAASFHLRYRVYSLPGGISLPAHRDEVLDQVDGVIFVADARQSATQANVDSLLELERALAVQGLELATLAVAIQVNHADEQGARPVDDVAFDLNPYGFPVVAAVASQGEGVAEAHKAVADQLALRIRAALTGQDAAISLVAVHRPHQERDEHVVRAHIEVIRQKTATRPEALLEAPEETEIRSALEPTLEIAFSPRDLVFARPLEVLSAELDEDKIRVQLLMDPLAGGELQKMTLILTPTARAPTDSPPPLPPLPGPGPGAFLPDSVDFPDPASEEEDPDDSARQLDVPSWLYGVVGLGSGIAMGLLVSYLVGLS